ncbi:hypothetical protein BJP34_24640 [Moorena producens PAL-8-15-08-1]|uniref:Uncharacterized protein n=1 Tax=Moorena producens PAL-8-15-08-1 TaxID=1458985 RepID=A0A1D8TX14_9CYAN|nr:hypothetical protein BJP34_24640 [Moorena producens PAL-8-15-08-1]
MPGIELFGITWIDCVADYGYGQAPLAPQFWGEQDFQSPPNLGDQRGLDQNQMIPHSFLNSATAD